MEKLNIISRLHDKFLTLRRVTYSTNFIAEIDGLRFLAIISVVMLHLKTHLMSHSAINWDAAALEQNPLYWVLSRSGLGVFIFFSISGFVLALPFIRQYHYQGKKVSIKKYFIRRLTRLEPPFLITSVLFLIFYIIVKNIGLDELLGSFIAMITYTHYFIYGNWSPINPVTWSLETEVQFYILAPLFFFLTLRLKSFKVRILLNSFITMVCLYFSMLYFEELKQLHLPKSIILFFPYFQIGIIFCDFYLKFIKKNRLEKKYIWDMVGLAGIIGVYTFIVPMEFVNYLLQVVSIFLIFCGAFLGKVSSKIYSNIYISIIGGMCYTIYLIHYPAINFFLLFTGNLTFTDNFVINYLLQFIIVVPILLIISTLAFAFIEKPFMQRDWWKQINYSLLSVKK